MFSLKFMKYFAMDDIIFKEPLINSATHLHASALSSCRRQILDVAPLRLRVVSSIEPAHLRKSGRLHFIRVSYNDHTRYFPNGARKTLAKLLLIVYNKLRCRIADVAQSAERILGNSSFVPVQKYTRKIHVKLVE